MGVPSSTQSVMALESLPSSTRRRLGMPGLNACVPSIISCRESGASG